ncbi:MAG: hypothetical protein P4L99_27760 [Chthoniobacter sp.]|nr:hypothetical protein [Chthoniobacter sp.]
MNTSTPFQAAPLIRVDLSAADFAANWQQCDRVANYLARTVSSDRPDTFLHANLLSTALNELFEIAFVQHRHGGKITCELLRHGAADRVELTIPVDATHRAYYRQQVEYIHSGNAAKLYAAALLGETAPDTAIGLLELAADYGAVINLDETLDDSHLRLVVEMQLSAQAA